ncbi:MAG: DUF962 domain-containing protein [Oligoflexia bacterium]|nr:DUF962 domain-containing protein [Oligoflexia bacterium]
MNTQTRIQTYKEFWPFYVGEHSKPTNRLLHFIGTSIGFVCLINFVLTLNPKWIGIGLIAGYAFAWIGHFVIEKNRPATFKYPFWSFISDWRMWFLMLTGRMNSEIQKGSKGMQFSGSNNR